MRLGLMQPYFFPYIGYWQLINAVDKYVIFDDVNFIKGGWINRNHVLNNGARILINVRTHGASSNQHINVIAVADDHAYCIKILKMLKNVYSRAPYFDQTYPIIERILNQEEKNLARYLEFGIRQVCDYLSINTQILLSSSIEKNNGLRGQAKVIEVVKQLGADEYINAIGGQQLYSYADFAAQGIGLKFLKTGEIEYQQFKKDFVPNLSIIDVMMFNSKEDIKIMLGNYELI